MKRGGAAGQGARTGSAGSPRPRRPEHARHRRDGARRRPVRRPGLGQGPAADRRRPRDAARASAVVAAQARRRRRGGAHALESRHGSTARRCSRSCPDSATARRRRCCAAATSACRARRCRRRRRTSIYWADLVGLAVVNRQAVALGKVDGGRGFRRASGAARARSGDGSARLIPFVAAYVDGVDVASAADRRRLAAGLLMAERQERRVRIDVVTLFPEMVAQAAGVRRHGPGAGARAVAARRVESARFRDGQRTGPSTTGRTAAGRGW